MGKMSNLCKMLGWRYESRGADWNYCVF